MLLEFVVHQRVSLEVTVQPWLVLASRLIKAAIQHPGSLLDGWIKKGEKGLQVCGSWASWH